MLFFCSLLSFLLLSFFPFVLHFFLFFFSFCLPSSSIVLFLVQFFSCSSSVTYFFFPFLSLCLFVLLHILPLPFLVLSHFHHHFSSLHFLQSSFHSCLLVPFPIPDPSHFHRHSLSLVPSSVFLNTSAPLLSFFLLSLIFFSQLRVSVFCSRIFYYPPWDICVA